MNEITGFFKFVGQALLIGAGILATLLLIGIFA